MHYKLSHVTKTFIHMFSLDYIENNVRNIWEVLFFFRISFSLIFRHSKLIIVFTSGQKGI